MDQLIRHALVKSTNIEETLYWHSDARGTVYVNSLQKIMTALMHPERRNNQNNSGVSSLCTQWTDGWIFFQGHSRLK